MSALSDNLQSEEEDSISSYFNNLKAKVKSLRLTDGDLVFFKDNTEEWKELTDEEKTELKKKESKQR